MSYTMQIDNTNTTIETIFSSLKTPEEKVAFWANIRKTDMRMKQFIDEVLATHIRGEIGNNPVASTDSYKASQFNMFNDEQFDEDGLKERLVEMYAFIEPRKGAKHSHVVVAGVQVVTKQLANICVTMKHIKDMICFYASHFSTPTYDGRYTFNPYPWLKVVLEYDGKLPLQLHGLPEGTIVSVAVPIVTLESVDSDCAQLVSHFEGLVQKAIWYPTTVATNALAISSVILNALKQTATDEVIASWLPFAIQDFGYRAVTSEESATIGGLAALYITMGSDTVTAVALAMDTLSGGSMVGYSVAACEHNQAFSKGRKGEFKFIKRLITETYPSGILSVVADTYDTEANVEMITTGELRDLILARDGTYVIRPDSQLLNEDGTEMTPAETISKIFSILDKNLKEFNTVNEKGFKVLNKKYKVIYGDGLTPEKIKQVLKRMVADGWCASNIVFGVGGNLLQNVTRDTERFAMKASQLVFEVENTNGNVWMEVRDTCKETPGKQSKKGRFHICSKDGVIQCFDTKDATKPDLPNMLEMYFSKGEVVHKLDDLSTIRERISDYRNLYGF